MDVGHVMPHRSCLRMACYWYYTSSLNDWADVGTAITTPFNHLLYSLCTPSGAPQSYHRCLVALTIISLHCVSVFVPSTSQA